MKKISSYFLIAFLALSLLACDEVTVVHDLSERDANDIVVLLAKNEIHSTKTKEERNQEVFWNINVKQDDEMKARGILVANNLPKVRQGGLKGICESTSMIVTEETEKCRKLLAYKGEIINSLESIPGVVSADVVLNIPDIKEFADENTPESRPTAAVTIKYLTDANVKTDLTDAKVQEFVANSITGLDARDVSVIISFLEQKLDKVPNKDEKAENKAQEAIPVVAGNQVIVPGQDQQGPLVSVGGIMMDAESAKKFKIISVVFLSLLFLLSAAFIYALLRMSKLRKMSSAMTVESGEDDKDDKKLLQA